MSESEVSEKRRQTAVRMICAVSDVFVVLWFFSVVQKGNGPYDGYYKKYQRKNYDNVSSGFCDERLHLFGVVHKLVH